MLRRLRSYLALAPGDRRLLRRAFVALALVELGLRRAGVRGWSTRTPATNGRAVDAAALLRARRYARFIDLAARHHPLRARCLHRSLALQGWLRREGLPSTLRIGVRREGGAMLAHAWVELAGQVVNDRPAAVAAFTPLAGPARDDGRQVVCMAARLAGGTLDGAGWA